MTAPELGGVTVDQVRATVPAPGVTPVIDGAPSEPTLAAAAPEPAAEKYATAPTTPTNSATRAPSAPSRFGVATRNRADRPSFERRRAITGGRCRSAAGGPGGAAGAAPPGRDVPYVLLRFRVRGAPLQAF